MNLLIAISLLSAAYAPAPTIEIPELTFGFFGCNRIDAKDWEEATNPSSANLPQLRQNLLDLSILNPDLVFFGGDLVIGYADDKGQGLRKQMEAWISEVSKAPKGTKSEYVAISGNHELNRKVEDQKLPNPATDPVWSQIVSSAGLVPKDATGPTLETAPDDRLIDDQSKLTFSFNRGSAHFVVINTDTRVTQIDAETKQTKIAMVPVKWIAADLAKAQKDPKINSIILMGHRNLVDGVTAAGDAPIDPAPARELIDVLDSYSKVRAYVCAHVHAFDITTFGKNKIHQLIFGNGGSSLEKKWKPKEGRTFGFGLFKVYRNGDLGVVPYLRPEPENYMEPKTLRAQPRAELIIKS